ncbi:hypothetical protein [Saccharopolyspora tripterygii]
MTAIVRGQQELSCYTSNLLTYLEAEDTSASNRLAEAIDLRVQLGETEELIFSHHERVDRDPGDRELGYRGAARWAQCVSGLRDEVEAQGRVLAVANTRFLPWAPGDAETPHWVLLTDRDSDRWHVVDRFSALFSTGEQHPHEQWITDEELRAALTPVCALARTARNRDAYALGERIAVPDEEHYRWLVKQPSAGASSPRVRVDINSTLGLVAERIVGSVSTLAAHVEDLWAAARHQRFQLNSFVHAGLIDGEVVRPAWDAWGELPRSLRFALDSARRSRPRPALLEKTLGHLAEVTHELHVSHPQLFPKG